MGIPMNSLCVECRLRKDLDTARQLGDAQTATDFARAHMQLFLQMDKNENSAYFGALVDELLQKFYHLEADRFKEEKDASNAFVLQRLDTLRQKALETADPVYAALQLAVLGNYIDFSALRGEVDFSVLDGMLNKARDLDLDKDVYKQFLSDCENGKNLLYITDNAGEIAFDRVFAEQLQEKYPHLNITFCVRGKPVNNDATREDAAAVGITWPVIDHGCAIGGVSIGHISQKARDALESADVVLAKGMGNTESMFGCGYNVYYAFLVKCDRFMQYFNKPKMAPMFVRDAGFVQ